MSEAKPNQEPTMEEILASIRRIISEDGEAPPKEPEAKDAPAAPKPAAAPPPPSPPPAAAAPPPPPPAPPPAPKVEEEEILELTEVVAEQAPPPPPPPAEPVQAAPPPPPPQQPQPTVADLMADDLALVSAPVAQQAASTFSNLASTVSQVRGLPIGSPNRTLEDIVKELLRPMLKDWLDANLPTLVHRIVEREVAKLAGRVDESQNR